MSGPMPIPIDAASVRRPLRTSAWANCNAAEASTFPRGVPQDGGRGGRSGRDLRLRVAGDYGSAEEAGIVARAAEHWEDRGGGAVLGYTHSWRTIPREWFGQIRIQASVERPEQIAAAHKCGYDAAIVAPRFPRDRAFALPGTTSMVIPCPAQTSGTSCVRCRLSAASSSVPWPMVRKPSVRVGSCRSRQSERASTYQQLEVTMSNFNWTIEASYGLPPEEGNDMNTKLTSQVREAEEGDDHSPATRMICCGPLGACRRSRSPCIVTSSGGASQRSDGRDWALERNGWDRGASCRAAGCLSGFTAAGLLLAGQLRAAWPHEACLPGDASATGGAGRRSVGEAAPGAAGSDARVPRPPCRAAAREAGVGDGRGGPRADGSGMLTPTTIVTLAMESPHAA